MATNERKSGSSGRTPPKTPAKGGATKAGQAKPSSGQGPARGRPGPAEPIAAVGRRPSSPGFLAVVAVMWMAVGVVLFLTLTISWRLVPAIVAFGIGVMFLRGSVTTVMRRERRQSDS